MDLGVTILYMMYYGHKVPLHNMYRELTRVSPIFYYLEQQGVTSKQLKEMFNECNKKTIQGSP